MGKTQSSSTDEGKFEFGRELVTSTLSEANTSNFNEMISCSEKMAQLFRMVKRVSTTSSTVLILGESGTGKELIARAIHRESKRSGKLIPVNCGAIPEEILESELFGHERGAFTGATSSKPGRFQLANGGTIFLDEIGEMSPKLQVKLLRVLQERKVDPVGSTRSLDIDVRVIAATHKDLLEATKRKEFREDLYYRLAVVPLELPALRNRKGDVALLANYFLGRACIKMGRSVPQFSEEATLALESYSWPGNVRELENLMERIAIMIDDELITLNDLPVRLINNKLINQSVCNTARVSLPPQGLNLSRYLEDTERELVAQALIRTDWNKTQAAELLSLTRIELHEKIKLLKIVKDGNGL